MHTCLYVWVLDADRCLKGAASVCMCTYRHVHVTSCIDTGVFFCVCVKKSVFQKLCEGRAIQMYPI